jgi:hypothetical protein
MGKWLGYLAVIGIGVFIFNQYRIAQRQQPKVSIGN